MMRITLLRSTTMPDPLADTGQHQLKYSLYPHTGPWNEDTQREAYLLNDPIIVYRQNAEDRNSVKLISTLNSLISTNSPNVILETVKRAEDEDGIIVRLYESQRQRGPVQVRAGFGLAAAWTTNLLEENESELSVENDSVLLDLRPYQIVTLRLLAKDRAS
jgi:alpha-mannosidase